MALQLPQTLIDQPSLLSNKWKGYYRKIDPTVLPLNTLTFPSVNCTIPNFDRIVPDKGKKLLGQVYTENTPIIGNKEKFVNLAGDEMEVRVWNSIDTPGKGDVIEVLYNGSWVAITETTNPLPVGVHRYSFDDWWDSNIDLSLSKNLPRLIWVNGYEDSSTKKGAVFSWTGGIVAIDSLTPTTLTIANNTPWRSLGFTEDINGDAFIVINGTSYQLVDPTDLDTDTIALASTTGITVGDIATNKIEEDEVPIPFDFCRENKGYMYYGNWKQRKLYQSNAFNHPATQLVTQSNAIQDDLTTTNDSEYTGTGVHTYKVSIDTISPPENNQVYSGTGANDAAFDTTNYSASGKNVYKVSVVADFGMTFVGTPTGWIVGEIVQGGTSGALARVFSPDSGGSDLFLITISGTFAVGEVVTGQSSGTFGTTASVTYQSVVQTFKNGVSYTPTGFTTFVGYQFLVNTYTNIIDGLDFVIGTTNTGDNWATHDVGDYWELTISEGGADTFTVQVDDATPGGSTAITGAAQNIAPGVDIQFVSTTGHAVGDFWVITVNQKVERAWVDFYYTLPVRKPGEGYIFTLPSNFWTMDTQEEQMYVNTSYGQWVIVTTQLSGDLQSESIQMTPLKQSGSNKVIDPWLTGHIENDLVYVTVDKNLDSIGRKEFLQLPQSSNLSDPVKLDFLESTFVGGGIKYVGKRLYISSPVEGIMHCYDKLMKYWQPPKKFVEMGIPSIVGNELIVHSNIRNQSFTMFADATDNGSAYTVTIRTPYTAADNRWKSKNSSMSFVEGYIEGNPQLTHTVLLEPYGCGGILPHTIDSVVCIAADRAPLGEGPLGSHPLGSDVSINGNYFQEIYKSYSPILSYYFLAMQIECTSKNHTWSILSLGMNAMYSNTGNNSLVNPSTKVV